MEDREQFENRDDNVHDSIDDIEEQESEEIQDFVNFGSEEQNDRNEGEDDDGENTYQHVHSLEEGLRIGKEIIDRYESVYVLQNRKQRQILFQTAPERVSIGYLYCKDLSWKDYNKLLYELKVYAKKKREEFRRMQKLEKEHEEREERQRSVYDKKLTLAALDGSHAKIVRRLTEATGWFADVLSDVGFYATIIALQHAKVPPSEIYDRVVEFKDPIEFSEFVKNHLAALLEATEDAKALLKLRQKIEVLDAKLLLLREAFEELKRQRDELILMSHTMMSSMCSDCMQRFMLAWMGVRYGYKLADVKVGGGDGGARGSVSAGSGEEEGDSRGGSEAAA